MEDAATGRGRDAPARQHRPCGWRRCVRPGADVYPRIRASLAQWPARPDVRRDLGPASCCGATSGLTETEAAPILPAGLSIDLLDGAFADNAE